MAKSRGVSSSKKCRTSQQLDAPPPTFKPDENGDYPFRLPGTYIDHQQLLDSHLPRPDGRMTWKSTFQLLNLWLDCGCSPECLPTWIHRDDAALYAILQEQAMRENARLEREREEAATGTKSEEASPEPVIEAGCVHRWQDRRHGGRWCVACGAVEGGGFVQYATVATVRKKLED